MLTALACAVSAMPVLTASSFSWEEPTEYLVTKVQINETTGFKNLTLQEFGTTNMWTLSDCGADMDAVFGEDLPEYGDIISLSPPNMVAEVYPGCLHYDENSPECENFGNITEIGKPEYLTFVKQEGSEYIFRNDDLGLRYYYAAEEYGGLPDLDLDIDEKGLFYLYNNLVILQTSEEEISPDQIPSTATAILVGDGLADVSGIGLCQFTAAEDSYGNELGVGDAVRLKLRGMTEEVYPARLPQIERIDYLGTAAEWYGYGEYTVTENDGNYLSLTDKHGETARYCYEHPELSDLVFYNSEMAENAQPGDILAFMHNYDGLPAVPFDPEQVISRTEFAVIGVDDVDHPQDYIIIRSESPTAVYQLSAGDIAAYLADGGEPLSYGDIFTLAGEYAYTCIWGTNDIMLSKPETIRIEGSVFDKAETADFTFNSASATTFVGLDGEEKGYEYPVDFMIGTGLMFGSDYTQPDGIDWTKPERGDQITMYTYNGVPMFPKSMQRIGDADGDSNVNASDAAEMLIIAAENGAGARNAVTFSNDVNADGVTDAEDAAAVLIYAAAKGTGSFIPWEDIFA